MKYCILRMQCEMKFAHIRVSEYFTFAKQIFHREAISLARRANFVEKKTGQDLSFFLVGDGGFGPPKSIDSRFTVCPLWPLGKSPWS